MQTVEDRLELPTDFWETLDLEEHRKKAEFFVDSGAEIGSYTLQGRLRLQTRRLTHLEKRNKNGNYSTTIFNERALIEASQISPLNVPGYEVSSKTTDSYIDAVATHHAALKKLSGLAF